MYEKIKKMDLKELQELLSAIQEEISARSEKKAEIHLYSNRYKGSGKCWVARVDKYKKICGFVEPHTIIPIDNYKRKKIFLLSDGEYLLCQEGTGTRDNREYIIVQNGEIKEN